MLLRPRKVLTEQEIKRGLSLVIGDGLAAEAMTSFVGGAFLVAMALLVGASNFQIGLLAGMPTFTNLFQLLSIYLVRKYNNRRAVVVICTLLARAPLMVIGTMLLLFGNRIGIETVIAFLFFYYFFGSIAGPSWNSWMKDLVPHESLGAYFARRTSYTQTLNVVLTISLALAVDYVKDNYPEQELMAYGTMFAVGGTIGIVGSLVLSRVQEPQSYLTNENLFRLLGKPFKDANFVRLLTFNSAWVFSLNLATPFFTVFMMTTLGLPLSYIVGLSVIAQLCAIFTVRIWGAYADKYSNKTVIAIGAPLYILCILAWCFVGIYSRDGANLALLVVIHVVTGLSTAGINLSLTNIGLKLAPKEDAIVYLTARNIVTAAFSSVAPLIGGFLGDFFSQRSLTIDAKWSSPHAFHDFPIVALNEWTFVFLIAAGMAMFALELIAQVREVGEVEKDLVKRIIRKNLRSTMRDFFVIGNLMGWHDHLWTLIRKKASAIYFRKGRAS